MFEISEDMSWEVRKKRAYKRMTITKTADEIGISRQTLRKIESGDITTVNKIVFVKLTNWLTKELI